jgi:hypothetical protein
MGEMGYWLQTCPQVDAMQAKVAKAWEAATISPWKQSTMHWNPNVCPARQAVKAQTVPLRHV